MSLNGRHPRDPLDSVDAAIEKLEGTDWTDEEPITETNITVEKGATVVITGKHPAMSKDQADEITLTDHGQPPRKEQDSLPERAADAVGDVVQKVDTWPRVVALGLIAVVALAAIAAYVVLNR